jgi:SAM-dependent methyltransferase
VSDTPSLLARAAHALQRPFRKARYKAFKARLGDGADAQAKFSEIYADNLWNDVESRSGPGSTMAYTASVRRELERLLAERKIGTFLDAPCGDFHWMRAVPLTDGTRYIGGDIVPALAADLQKKYGGDRHTFVTLDITKGPLPDADLWMCRDCLFHLSYADIARALRQLAQSRIPLVLLTTYIVQPGAPHQNRDIVTGDARPIDLRSEPFGFPEPLERFDDWIAPFAPREMGLWTREQLLPAAERMAKAFLA